jgi:hypothetical protein
MLGLELGALGGAGWRHGQRWRNGGGVMMEIEKRKGDKWGREWDEENDQEEITLVLGLHRPVVYHIIDDM